MKIQIKIYHAPKNWRVETITIPDKFEDIKEGSNDEYWEEIDTTVGLNIVDELHEWIHAHLRDRIGNTGSFGDRKADTPPIMFRIFNVFV